MYISHVSINNFRNFKELSIDLKPYTVIVGANKAGKSNFIEAIKLAISPHIRRDSATLNEQDFWSGSSDDANRTIKIFVEFTLEDTEIVRFTNALVSENVARFNFIFRQRTVHIEDGGTDSPDEETETRYEYFWLMGDTTGNSKDLYKRYITARMAFEVLDALRDAESLVKRWTTSPLKLLLRHATSEYDLQNLIERLIKEARDARDSDASQVKQLIKNLNQRGENMVGSLFNIDSNIDLEMFSEIDEFLRLLKLQVDGNRDISRASLGTQNILYLSLLLEEMEVRHTKEKDVQLILALEEPESHIHPHVQRSLFSYFNGQNDFVKSLIITTHSNHIASVSPITSIVIMRDYGNEGTKADYIRNDLSKAELDDFERYFNVTRAELVFSKGVVFVEGISEEYLFPAYAKILFNDLDHQGISVIAIHSTNFEPFIKLVSRRNFNIPYAILTDGDPHVKNEAYNGLNRGRRLIQAFSQEKIEVSQLTREDLRGYGIFVGDVTIEVDLILSGNSWLIEDVFKSFISENIRGREDILTNFTNMVSNIRNNPTKENIEEYISEITYRSGKGRFAQRLSQRILESKTDKTERETLIDMCPDYIGSCIDYIVRHVSPHETKE